MARAGEEGDLPRLTVAARALGLLAAEGTSLGFAGWAICAWDELVPYATHNKIAQSWRWSGLGAMAAGAALAAVLGALVVLGRTDRGLDLLSRIACRFAPLCLVGLLPLLFKWEIWVGRDLAFLVLASLFGLGLQGLMRVALSTPPVLGADLSKLRLWQRGALPILCWSGLPLTIACLAASLCAAYFGYYTVAYHHNVHTSGYDLGIETNLIWNAAHGGPLFRSTPLGGPMTHVGHHHTFFAYVIAPVFRLFPRPETLLVLQAIFMGASAIPLFLIARRRVGPPIACLVVCLLVLYPPLHGSVLYDFHYQPLSTFFVLMSLHLLEVRRNGWAALVILLTLSLREDIAALLAVLGLYLAVTGRRPRAGLGLAAAGLACFVVQKMIVMPHLHGGVSVFINRYEKLLPPGEREFGGVLRTVLANPAFAMHGLLEQVKYVLQIFAPLAFLPWRRPVGWLLFLPGFFFTLLATNYPALLEISFQYTAYWTPFVFLAAIDALAWIRRAERHGPSARVSSRAWLVAVTLSMLACSNQHGAIFQHNTSRSGYDAFEFGRTPEDDRRHHDLYALIAEIPPMASVVATERVIPHVASRPDAFNMRFGPYDAEYMLIGSPLRGDEKRPIRNLLEPGTFGIVEIRGAFALAKRGHSTDQNEALLELVGK